MLKNNNKIYYKKSFHDLGKLNWKIKTKEKIIITMILWKKRIKFHKAKETLLTNSLSPYKLILN
jgi:hypothetical protein